MESQTPNPRTPPPADEEYTVFTKASPHEFVGCVGTVLPSSATHRPRPVYRAAAHVPRRYCG